MWAVRFFDAHCDTIGKILEDKADFTRTGDDAVELGDGAHGGDRPGTGRLHVTLPGLRAAGVCAQVFASWVWSEKHRGRELEVGLEKVEAVRRLCEEHPADLFLALTGAEVSGACERSGPAQSGMQVTRGGVSEPGLSVTKTAIIASLEGADPLQGDVDNLAVFYQAGVRLLTLAWGDNAFCGSTYGPGTGLTVRGEELVAACEDLRVLVDVSHSSDQAFADICPVATRPFIASHSNCRALCPSPRNLTDEMIRALADRGGVVGITLAPGFLSRSFLKEERPLSEAFFRAIAAGTESFEEAVRKSSMATAQIPRPPLELIVDHVRWAMNVGGEDAVGLGGDLDGIDALPLGLEGVADYPRIAELLTEAGLTAAQVDKVCHGNFVRVFRETLA